jgi:orotate phosphoribosyltransferase
MALDLPALLRETGALLQGHFRLSSALHSPYYVQCALLLEHPRNAVAIAEELAALVRPLQPTKIAAPALGGVVIGFAVAQSLDVPFIFTERKGGDMTLRRGFRVDTGESLVVVEDVVTTGKSTRETADVLRRRGARVVGFASILNRSGKQNPFDAPYVALLSLELEAYDEGRCPLCANHVALDAPGSRYSGSA